VIEHRENTITGKEVVKKLPGQKKYGDIPQAWQDRLKEAVGVAQEGEGRKDR
jgi:hypothetical protein